MVRTRIPRMMTAPVAILVITALALGIGAASAGTPRVKHVVVVGVDGMSPAGIRAASTPNLDAMMARGAYTMTARAVMPTSSSPNWASMIMGAGPEQHGVTSNDWQPDQFDIAPVAVGPGGIFPTIFSALREQRPKSHLAVFYDWSGFGRLFEHDAVDWSADTKGPNVTTQRAAEYIVEHKPALTFIHLDHVDHAGHGHGWGSPEYLRAVEEADRYVGAIEKAIDESGASKSTILLVTSDHGGKGTHHGGATMEEIEIPWMVAGPGVVENHEIVNPVYTYQTAATIAYLLNVTPPPAWIATPVLEAFNR